MKWVERKEIATTSLTTTIDVVELFLELDDGNSIRGYYYHNYSDMNQNKWFISGEVVRSRNKKFFVKLSEPEWFACKEYNFIKISNKEVEEVLKTLPLKEVKNLRKILY